MFEKVLEKYTNNGSFTFIPNEDLERKCNAPTDKNGVYLIYQVVKGEENLLYIGSSGQFRNGQMSVRKSGLGGMKDRLVNGYHPKFDKVRRKYAFPNQMRIDEIEQIKIYWWVTWDKNHKDVPTKIEGKLKQLFEDRYHKGPLWHK